MKEPMQKPQKPGSRNPSEENDIRQNPITQGQGTRHWESGRNPDMQVQRSNRQGDGNPTQQRREDR